MPFRVLSRRARKGEAKKRPIPGAVVNFGTHAWVSRAIAQIFIGGLREGALVEGDGKTGI
jgi:hypothetical protein